MTRAQQISLPSSTDYGRAKSARSNTEVIFMLKKITAIALVLTVVVCCFAGCAFTPDKKIIGSWKDSSGVLGIEFKDGGVVKFSGNASAISPALSALSVDTEGTYAVSKDENKQYHLVININIVIAVKLEYIISEVTSDVLTLKAVDSDKSYTFVKADTAKTTSSAPAAESTTAA